MRAAAGFIVVSGASLLALASAQTLPPAPNGSGSAPEDAVHSGPLQFVPSHPEISFAIPRAAFKGLPVPVSPARTPSSNSSAPPPADVDSNGIDEVTVTAQRTLPIQQRARIYVETKVYDPLSVNMAIANGRVCADQSKLASTRIADCDMAIWMVKHGVTMEDVDLSIIYVARALALQELGKDSEAVSDFRIASKLDPNNPRPWLSLGNFYVAKMEFEQAINDYDRALSISPNDPVSRDNRGTALEALGRHNEAIADFSRAISIDPRDTAALMNRATVYLSSSRQELAIPDLTEVIDEDPSNHLAYYNRGAAYELNGAPEKAIVDYREAARRKPTFAPALAALGRLNFADPQAALEELAAAIRIDPNSPALRTRARLYLALHQPELALKDLDRYIANDALDASAWANRGVAKSQLGDYEGAIADCTQAIEMSPTALNLVNRGNAYATLHDAGNSLNDFNSALQADPENLQARLGRANANYMGKHLKESLEDYSRVIEVDSRNTLAYFRRGNIYLDLKDYKAAYNDYSVSLQLDANQPAVLLNRSIAESRLGRRADAASDQRKALSLDPTLFDGGTR